MGGFLPVGQMQDHEFVKEKWKIILPMLERLEERKEGNNPTIKTLKKYDSHDILTEN